MDNQLLISSSKKQHQQWCDLPQEILELILSYLSGGDVTIFHSVCKTWQTIIRSAPHRPLPVPSFDFLDHSSAWLISFPSGNNSGRCRFFNPINNDNYEIIIPELSYATIFFAKCGWFLGLEETRPFLFELSTKKKIQVPEPLYYICDTMMFTSSPLSPDCLVIGIWVGKSIDILIHKLGEAGWQHYNPSNDTGELILMTDCIPAFYNGNYYWLENKGNLLIFDPTDVDGSFEYILNEKKKPMFDKYPLGGSAHQIFLVENEGDLLAVFITKYTRIVYVYKWDECDRSFRLIENLGNNMLFVSSGAAFSQKAVVTGTGNKIYFPTFSNKNDQYTFYSLATKRYHSFFSSFSQANPYGLRQLRSGFWFKPT